MSERDGEGDKVSEGDVVSERLIKSTDAERGETAA